MDSKSLQAEESKNLVKLPNSSATAVLEKNSNCVVCVTPETIEGSPTAELPNINYVFNGRKYRYCYMTTTDFDEKQRLSKFDVVEKKVFIYLVEDGLRAGEPVFLARPGAIEEDDGVVLSTIIACEHDLQSYLVILDAKTFKEVARAKLPEKFKMSFTFHGTFTDKTF